MIYEVCFLNDPVDNFRRFQVEANSMKEAVVKTRELLLALGYLTVTNAKEASWFPELAPTRR